MPRIHGHSGRGGYACRHAWADESITAFGVAVWRAGKGVRGTGKDKQRCQEAISCTGTLSINDDDLPVVSVYPTNPFASLDQGTTGQFTVTRTGPHGGGVPLDDPLTIDYASAITRWQVSD